MKTTAKTKTPDHYPCGHMRGPAGTTGAPASPSRESRRMNGRSDGNSQP